MKSLALALDNELRRVAAEEDVTLDEMVNEIAALIGKTARMLYNYRSGKWDLPSSLIPVLCARFKSHTLLNALAGELKETIIEVPQGIEFSQLAIQILRQICDHHHALIEAYKTEATDLNTLSRLEEQTEQIIQRERHLFTLLEAEYEQRVSSRRKPA